VRVRAPAEAGRLPAWINAWGLAAFTLATVGLLSASLVGARNLTLALAALGLAAAVVGTATGGRDRQPGQRLWLRAGGVLSGLLLAVTLFFPGLINHYWAIDVAVTPPDAGQHVAVTRDQPRDSGRTLTAADSADAAGEMIRHDDLLISIESVKAGPVGGEGQPAYALVHCRFANIGGGLIRFQGFDKDKRQPKLTDAFEHACAFREQRKRLQARGEAVFGAPTTDGMELSATAAQGYLLVFELPPAGLASMELEVPASAWGRQGVYRFRIAGPFEASLPKVPSEEKDSVP
jgi:hypothetical protein